MERSAPLSVRPPWTFRPMDVFNNSCLFS